VDVGIVNVVEEAVVVDVEVEDDVDIEVVDEVDVDVVGFDLQSQSGQIIFLCVSLIQPSITQGI
jgi:hypothetical protein